MNKRYIVWALCVLTAGLVSAQEVTETTDIEIAFLTHLQARLQSLGDADMQPCGGIITDNHIKK